MKAEKCDKKDVELEMTWIRPIFVPLLDYIRMTIIFRELEKSVRNSAFMNANKFDMKDTELEIIVTWKHSITVPSLDCIMMPGYFQRQKREKRKKQGFYEGQQF